MKNKIIIVLILIIIVLAGIIIKDNVKFENNNYEEKKIITKEELASYITKIAITKENWNEYIVLEDKENVSKDAFGEITSIQKSTYFKLKDDTMISNNIALKVKVNKDLLAWSNEDEKQISIISSGGMELYGLKNKSSEPKTSDTTITINDFEVIQTTGEVCILNIPDDVWQGEEGADKCIYVKNDSAYNGYDLYFKYSIEEHIRNGDI